jgi:hypothetical protein
MICSCAAHELWLADSVRAMLPQPVSISAINEQVLYKDMPHNSSCVKTCITKHTHCVYRVLELLLTKTLTAVKEKLQMYCAHYTCRKFCVNQILVLKNLKNFSKIQMHKTSLKLFDRTYNHSSRNVKI